MKYSFVCFLYRWRDIELCMFFEYLLDILGNAYSGKFAENWGKRWSFAMAMYNLYYANLSSQLW